MERILEILALLAAGQDEATTASLTAELATCRADMSDADLTALDTAVRAYIADVRAGNVEGVGATDVAAIRVLVTEVQAVASLVAQRATEAAAVDAELAELEAMLDSPTEEETPEETEAGASTETERELEGVTAGATPPVVPVRPALGSIRDRQPAATRPNPAGVGGAPARPSAHVVSTAGSGQFDTLTAAAAAFNSDFRAQGGNAGRRVHVEITADYPESHRLDETDERGNGRKIEAIVAAANDPSAWTDAVVAAGGWCAPAPVEYNQITQGITDTPVINSLPVMQMPRGGVRIPVNPTLDIIQVAPVDDPLAVGSAIGVWSEDSDIIAGDPNDDDYATTLKPIQWIDCPEYVEFRTFGVTHQLGFREMAARANPENVAAWNALLMVAWARKRETLVLDAMKAEPGTTNVTQAAPVLGAAIDVVELLLRLGASMTSAARMDEQTRLRAELPMWLPALLAADMARSGRSVFNDTNIVMARARIVEMLGNANITPTFYLDSPTTGTPQILRRQTDGAETHAWPTEIQFGLHFEGHYLFGDSGQIELGTIRDLALVQRNSFVNFAESFDGLVARRGPEALWVTQAVEANGTYSAPVDAVLPAGS